MTDRPDYPKPYGAIFGPVRSADPVAALAELNERLVALGVLHKQPRYAVLAKSVVDRCGREACVRVAEEQGYDGVLICTLGSSAEEG